MPRYTKRQRRAKELINTYASFLELRYARRRKRDAQDRRFRRRHGIQTNSTLPDGFLGQILDPSSVNHSHETTPSIESSDASSDSLLNSLGDSDLESELSSSDMDNTTDSEGEDSDSEGSDSDDDSDTSLGSITDESDSDFDIPPLQPIIDDDEDLWQDFDSDAHPPLRANLGRRIFEEIESMYSQRYEAPRTPFPRPPPRLPHILEVYKTARPDHFRKELRVTPNTFDSLLAAIKDDPVFSNNSDNEQMPVRDQLAITLYRFGHFGNAASVEQVASWAGYGAGTILLATKRVMTAILRRDFMDAAVDLPTAAEKEEAKAWVEEHSCAGWRDGWCMVDGTLVPLDKRPYWYGESYFDRKCNYSLNVQIINMPNLRIIDYGFGYTGSTHDSTAWQKTRLYQDHEDILVDDEFIWGDSAYPLETWVVAPFKRPEANHPDNVVFNNHVSMVRIRSEHAIGFLKGRFQSLKGLRIKIMDESSHKFATYWIVACIGIHAFAMKCEARDRNPDSDGDRDPFIAAGLSSDPDFAFEATQEPQPTRRRGRASALALARERRLKLKRRLFRALERRTAENQSHFDVSDGEEDMEM